jgi:hypothetical protein
MKTSENIDKIAPAFVAALGKMSDVVKDTANDFGGYKYATLDAVTAMARPILADHGLAVVQEVAEGEHAIKILTRVLHVSGQWFESEPFPLAIEDRKGMTHAQAIGSTITYGRRYALQAMLGITAEADDDASDAGKDTGKTPVGIARRAQLDAMKAGKRPSYPRRGDPEHGISEREEDAAVTPDFDL